MSFYYSSSRSRSCETSKHDECDKTYLIMDQDGTNRQVCQCSCHREQAVCGCGKDIFRETYAHPWKHSATRKQECGMAAPRAKDPSDP